MAIERVYDVLMSKWIDNVPDKEKKEAEKKGEPVPKGLIQKCRDHERKHAADSGKVQYLGGVSQDKNGYYMQAVTKEVDIQPKPVPPA